MNKPTLLLRSASVLTLIHAILHTVGGVFGAPEHGPDEVAVLDLMRAQKFDFMGSLRSYGDFYMGFGLFVTVGFLLQAVLLWQLASLVKTDALKARPFMLSLLFAFVAAAALSWRFFFIAPLAMEIVIALMIAAAYGLSRSSESRH